MIKNFFYPIIKTRISEEWIMINLFNILIKALLWKWKLEREYLEKEKENEMVDYNEENKDENVFDNDEYESIDEREVH